MPSALAARGKCSSSATATKRTSRVIFTWPSLSRADADAVSFAGDDVAELQLASPAAIDLAVDGHVAVDDGLFHVPAGVQQPGELQELPEADALTTDRDVFDRSRFRHSEMLTHVVLVDRVTLEQNGGMTDAQVTRETRRQQRHWGRHAESYDIKIQKVERSMLAGTREWIGERATGRVLEVAIGGGRSLPYYRDDVSVVGVTLSH